jgi:hypothetical protein
MFAVIRMQGYWSNGSVKNVEEAYRNYSNILDLLIN